MPQPPLRVGETHDIVVHLDTMNAVGFIVKPRTYHIASAPTFVPRMAIGDPRGIDYSLWRSFVQDDFSGGAGQYNYHGDMGNNRYAESSLLDIGLGGSVFNANLLEAEDKPISRRSRSEVVGGVASAILPQATSGGSESLFPNAYTAFSPAFVLQLNNLPYFIHHKLAAVYGSYSFVIATSPPPIPGAGSATNTPTAIGAIGTVPLLGWQNIGVGYSPVDRAVTAIRHSNTIFVGANAGGGGIQAYNLVQNWYTPTYSTTATVLGDYDGKLWKAHVNQLSYLDLPVINTARWSNPVHVGESTRYIRAMMPFQGRLYLAKKNGLWAYESGRTFVVQSFENEFDETNFNLFEQLHGALYFNITTSIYRLTAGGAVELLESPNIDGYVAGGATLRGLLYVLYRSSSGGSRVWRFDPTLGGWHEWFSALDIATAFTAPYFGPTSIKASTNQLWLFPMVMTGSGNPTQPVATFNHAQAYRSQLTAGYYNMGTGAYLTTSRLHLGYPGLDKLFNRVLLDFNLYGTSDAIDVYYSLDTEKAAQVRAAYTAWSYIGPPGPSQIRLQGDSTGVLWDGEAGPSAPTLALTNTEVSQPELWLGFTEPVDGVRLFAQGVSGWGWRTQYPQVYYTPSIGVHHSIGFAVSPSTLYPFPSEMIMTWPTPANWKTVTTIKSPGNDDTEVPALYYVLISPGLPTNAGDWAVLLQEARAVQSLGRKHSHGSGWTLLGTVSNRDTNKATLTFSDRIIGKHITLKFVFRGSYATRPELLRYELEWLPIGPNPHLLQAGATVLAINNLETLAMGVVENSANYISASLFSMAGSGVPYVVELPYPPPVAHTRRMRVSLARTGAIAPQLAYSSTLGSVGASIEAEIPIVLEEV